MKLLDGTKFELPNIFAAFTKVGQPPLAAPQDTREVSDVLAAPFVVFHNPDDLSFPDHMKPVVPGSGGYITMGLGPIEYDHQPQWDRGAVCQAGPVREFFRKMMFDNKVKHL